MTWWGVCMAGVFGVLFLAACSRDDTAPTPARDTPTPTQEAARPPEQAAKVIEVTLSFVAPHFRPDPIVLRVGEPVQFKVTSADTRHHLVIEGLSVEAEVPQKALNETVTTKVVTPEQVGTFRVFCRIHARLPMEGTLQVTDSGAATN